MDSGSAALLPAAEGAALFARIAGNIEKVMRGSRDGVRKLLAAFASIAFVKAALSDHEAKASLSDNDAPAEDRA